MDRVLVTGGLGFIGSHIVDYFISSGCEVSIIDNMTSNVLPQDYFTTANVLIGDIFDTSFIDSVFQGKKYDYIFHFAANASVPKSIQADRINFQSNVIGTYNIIRKAADCGSRIMLASTSAVYGEYNGKRVNEEDTVKPISPYGLSKLIDEELCFHYGRIYGFEAIAFRFFNVYGPRQRHYVMSDFLRKVSKASSMNTGNITMLGTGNEIRDFINIKDVIKAIALALGKDNMWGEAYNLGTGAGIKIRDLLNLMVQELGEELNILYSGTSWKGDISGLYADIEKIGRFGYRPDIGLESGIREFIQSERKSGLLSSTVAG